MSVTASLDRSQWLHDRQSYLGGTDVAALVGLNRYKTPLGVFLSKRGEVEDSSGVKAEMGTYLEPLIKAMFATETGLVVHDAPQHIRHRDYDFLGGNPDGVCATPDSDEPHPYDEGILECKTYDYNTADEWGEEWTDQVPKAYYCQCIWYLGLTGESLCYVAALHRTTGKFSIYQIKFNQELFDALVSEGVKFWNEHVLTGVEPAPGAADIEYLREKFPTDTGGMLIADAEIEAWVSEMKDLKKESKPLIERYEELKVLMIARMGENSLCATMEGDFTYRKFKPSKKTDWQLIAKGLLEELKRSVTFDTDTLYNNLLALYTVEKEGSRRFVTPFKDLD